MTDETKNTIMQTLHKISVHYGLHPASQVTFKKREETLLKLKSTNEAAWKVISDLINTHITSDRILNDKEKQAKKPDHWTAETTAAAEQIITAEKRLTDYCKANKISM